MKTQHVFYVSSDHKLVHMLMVFLLWGFFSTITGSSILEAENFIEFRLNLNMFLKKKLLALSELVGSNLQATFRRL